MPVSALVSMNVPLIVAGSHIGKGDGNFRRRVCRQGADPG